MDDSETPTFFWEACGVNGLNKLAAEAKNIPVEEINGKIIFNYANEGDEEILKVLDKFCYKLAVQIYNLHNIYNPERICIGGGISSQDILFEFIYKNIEKLKAIMPPNFVPPTIVSCEYKNDSNLIGALYNYLIKYN